VGASSGGLILEVTISQLSRPPALLSVLGGTRRLLVSTPLWLSARGMRSLPASSSRKTKDPESQSRKAVEYSTKANEREGLAELVADKAPGPVSCVRALPVPGTELIA